MKVDRRWLWVAGVLGAGGLGLALGVPLGTLLIVAALLACPVMMMRGMGGMQHGTGSMSHHGMESTDGKKEAARTISEHHSSEEPAPVESVGRN